MVRRRQRERSLFEVLLPDGHKLWPDWLRKIDTLLEDEAVIEVVAQALEARWPQSRRRGRPGTPAEVVIRMLILKHCSIGATTTWNTKSAPIGVPRVHADRCGRGAGRENNSEDRACARSRDHRAVAPPVCLMWRSGRG